MDEQINEKVEKREKKIVKTSIIGIVTNIFLVGFKAFVGFISNSIAVILDAVNNLSDALSSVVTIIGAKLGAKEPDKKHPLGYGRIEYLSSMIVAGLVLYAGITSIVESIKKIITPVEVDYSTVSIIIISTAVVVKIVLGMFVKRQGKKVDSSALSASGSDALFDAVLSFSVLVSAVIYLIWGLSLEAYVGVIISLFIIKAGIEMMIETLNDIIGKREDKDTIHELKTIIHEEKLVCGVYDVTIFNYGPNKNYGSVHIEVPDTLTINEVDDITRKIQVNVYKKTGIILTGIGVYSYNTKDSEAAEMRDRIKERILSYEWAKELHGFYLDREEKRIRFDVVITFDVDKKEAYEKICGDVKELYDGYELAIVLDADIAD